MYQHICTYVLHSECLKVIKEQRVMRMDKEVVWDWGGMTKYFKHKIKIIQEKSEKNLIFRNGILYYRMLSVSYIFILDIFSIKM